jgi:type I restriction enzyme R subunit
VAGIAKPWWICRKYPSSALVKLRTFVDSLADRIYLFYRLPKSYQPSLNDLFNNHPFKADIQAVT